jgi:predicted ArsR family transcriptional regulator
MTRSTRATERKEILDGLAAATGPLTAKDLAERTGLDQEAALNHLGTLRRRGQVAARSGRTWTVATARDGDGRDAEGGARA